MYQSADGTNWTYRQASSSSYPGNLTRYELAIRDNRLLMISPRVFNNNVYWSDDAGNWNICAPKLSSAGDQSWASRSAFTYRNTIVYLLGDERTTRPIQRWDRFGCPLGSTTAANLPEAIGNSGMRAVLIDREALPVYGNDFPLPPVRISVLGSLTIAANTTLAISLGFYDGAAPYTLSATPVSVGVSVISGVNADLHFAIPQSGSQVRKTTLNITHGESINLQLETRTTLTLTIRR